MWISVELLKVGLRKEHEVELLVSCTSSPAEAVYIGTYTKPFSQTTDHSIVVMSSIIAICAFR